MGECGDRIVPMRLQKFLARAGAASRRGSENLMTAGRVTVNGKVVFGLGCGIITVLIRKYGSYPEGVSFAILLMNILTPQLDKALSLIHI